MPDPFTTDPIFDPSFPPMTTDIHFKSHGALLNGVVHSAADAGPHPTVLILHGFPGNERNFDLAHLYRRAGLNTVVFHYRGSWGSEGKFSFANCLEDVGSALEYLLTSENQQRFRIDGSRLALVGHSMGGWIALTHGAKDTRIKTTISLCGVNFGDFASQLLINDQAIADWSQGFEEELDPLQGTTGSSLIQEVIQHGEQWNLKHLASNFSHRPVMLIAGSQDGLEISKVAFTHEPLVKAFRNSNVILEEKVYESAHSLASHRVTLAKDTLTFLQKHL